MLVNNLIIFEWILVIAYMNSCTGIIPPMKRLAFCIQLRCWKWIHQPLHYFSIIGKKIFDNICTLLFGICFHFQLRVKPVLFLKVSFLSTEKKNMTCLSLLIEFSEDKHPCFVLLPDLYPISFLALGSMIANTQIHEKK